MSEKQEYEIQELIKENNQHKEAILMFMSQRNYFKDAHDLLIREQYSYTNEISFLKSDISEAIKIVKEMKKFMNRLPSEWFLEILNLKIETFLSKHKELK